MQLVFRSNAFNYGNSKRCIRVYSSGFTERMKTHTAPVPG